MGTVSNIFAIVSITCHDDADCNIDAKIITPMMKYDGADDWDTDIIIIIMYGFDITLTLMCITIDAVMRITPM